MSKKHRFHSTDMSALETETDLASVAVRAYPDPDGRGVTLIADTTDQSGPHLICVTTRVMHMDRQNGVIGTVPEGLLTTVEALSRELVLKLWSDWKQTKPQDTTASKT